jgi:predicted O-methyltransferase YrrM
MGPARVALPGERCRRVSDAPSKAAWIRRYRAHRGIRQFASRDALRTLVRRPRWFFAQARQGPEFLLDKRRKTGAEPFLDLVKPEPEAASAVLGLEPGEYERVVESLWTPTRDPDELISFYGGRDALLRLVGAIVKLTQPRVVVETGVALGLTTATMLRAMEENGIGHLYSIDLPGVRYGPDRPVGQWVPAELRHRWTLKLGDSRRLLAPLVAEVAPIDLFLHDSFHTYPSQRREYVTVWPHLRPGAILASDDVTNPAFPEFAAEVGVEPYLVLGRHRRSLVGLLRKP